MTGTVGVRWAARTTPAAAVWLFNIIAGYGQREGEAKGGLPAGAITGIMLIQLGETAAVAGPALFGQEPQPAAVRAGPVAGVVRAAGWRR